MITQSNPTDADRAPVPSTFLTRLGALAERAERDPRLGWTALAALMAAAAVLSLALTAGMSFSQDELEWVRVSPHLGVEDVLYPHSGHLVAVSHLVYKVLLEAFGGAYLPFRLLMLGAVLACVGFLYAYLKRRLGGLVALAPCAVLLCFGPAAFHLVFSNGFTIIFALLCGVVALLLLDRGTRAGDVGAALALLLGVLTYTVAIAFVVGIGAYLLLRLGTRRRAWVAAPALLVFVGWRLWVRQKGFDMPESELSLANVLLVPAWSYESLAAVAAGFSGTAYDFTAPTGGTIPGAGPALALVFVAALLYGFVRRPGDWHLWRATLIALALFASQVLVWKAGSHAPGLERYMFPAAVVIVILAAEVLRGPHLDGRIVVAVGLVAVLAIMTNTALLGDRAQEYERVTSQERARLLGSLIVEGVPEAESPERMAGLPAFENATLMRDAYESYSGLAYTEPEIRGEDADTRNILDLVLFERLGIAPVAPGPGEAASCRRTGTSSESGPVRVPPGQSVLVEHRSPSPVYIQRFSDLPGPYLEGADGLPAAFLSFPDDRSSAPWRVESPGSLLTVCPRP